MAKHWQQSQYFLQILKCQDPSCCSSFETNCLTVIPDCFILFPCIYEYTNTRKAPVKPSRCFQNLSFSITIAPLIYRLLVKAIPEEGFHYDVIRFDLLCPSMEDKLDNIVCKACGKYWPSEASLKRHKHCTKNGVFH